MKKIYYNDCMAVCLVHVDDDEYQYELTGADSYPTFHQAKEQAMTDLIDEIEIHKDILKNLIKYQKKLENLTEDDLLNELHT